MLFQKIEIGTFPSNFRGPASPNNPQTRQRFYKKRENYRLMFLMYRDIKILSKNKNQLFIKIMVCHDQMRFISGSKYSFNIKKAT